MTGIALWRRYAAVSIRSQLQYRASVAMQSLGAFMVTVVEFAGIWALFARFGSVRGWTLPEIALFYGMISIAWSITDALARGFEVFGSLLKAGDFDRVLLRPRSTVLQLLGHELTVRRIGRFAQGACVLGYALANLDVPWDAPRVALLAAAIAGAICVFLGLVILQATTAFWTTETLEVWNAFTYGGVTMGQYPLAIYRPWFRKLFTYAIPLGAAIYVPGLVLLGRASSPAHWLAPLAGPGFLIIALQLWRFGVRRYRSTGS